MMALFMYFGIVLQTIVIALVRSEMANETSTLPNNSHVSDKHDSLFECELWQLDKNEFVIFPNGTAYVEIYQRSYNESFYLVVDDLIRICSPVAESISGEENDDERLISTPIEYLSLIGICISMVCLLLHLGVFAFVPDLQNLPGYNLASLCTSLFFSYLFYIISKTQQESEHPTLCIVSGVLTYFFFLSSFLWMLVMSFDVFRSILLATGSLRISSKAFKIKKFVWYSLFSWITALLFSVAAVTADNVESLPHEYRPTFYKSCWFEYKPSLLTFFAGPVGVIASLNFIMFGLSAYAVFSNRMKSDNDSNQRSGLKKNLLLYFRLSVIMGVTWITGVIAPIVNARWLWYVFATLNTFQGLFIFLAFTCTRKVRKHIKNKFLADRRFSQQTLSPTFQSYCFYANSIEKDLDKVMESKHKSDITDTIIIHL